MKGLPRARLSWSLPGVSFPHFWRRAIAASLPCELEPTLDTTEINSDARKRTIGHFGLHLDRIDSTQDAAIRIARSLGAQKCHGMVISAGIQDSGRGRGSHDWFSPSGCFMSTMCLLVPQESVKTLPVVQHLAAIATCKAAQTYARSLESVGGRRVDIRIKWPNDIYGAPLATKESSAGDPSTGLPVDRSQYTKLGGILCTTELVPDSSLPLPGKSESGSTGAGSMSYVVAVGLGLNVYKTSPFGSLHSLAGLDDMESATAPPPPPVETEVETAPGGLDKGVLPPVALPPGGEVEVIGSAGAYARELLEASSHPARSAAGVRQVNADASSTSQSQTCSVDGNAGLGLPMDPCAWSASESESEAIPFQRLRLELASEWHDLWVRFTTGGPGERGQLPSRLYESLWLHSGQEVSAVAPDAVTRLGSGSEAGSTSCSGAPVSPMRMQVDGVSSSGGLLAHCMEGMHRGTQWELTAHGHSFDLMEGLVRRRIT